MWTSTLLRLVGDVVKDSASGKRAAGARAMRSFAFLASSSPLLFAFAVLLCASGVTIAKQAESSQTAAVDLTEEEEAANRKALQDQAGKNAAKLMLRSTPDKSSVHIDGKLVGKTPLLLIIRPGVYVVEIEGGPRLAYGRRQIDLLPKESRDIALDLQPRYPTAVHLPLASR